MRPGDVIHMRGTLDDLRRDLQNWSAEHHDAPYEHAPMYERFVEAQSHFDDAVMEIR